MDSNDYKDHEDEKVDDEPEDSKNQFIIISY